MSEDDGRRDNPGDVLVPSPLIFLGDLIVGLPLDRIAGLPVPPSRSSRSVGLVLVAAGALLAGWFGRTMKSSRTSFRLNEPADKLLTEGPFHHSRNPGYLSFAKIYAGIALLARPSWSVLFLPVELAVIRVRNIEQEERYLERKFGEESRTLETKGAFTFTIRSVV